MPSVDSAEIAKEVRKQLTELGSKDGFHIRKWISQKPEVIEDTAQVQTRQQKLIWRREGFRSLRLWG